MNAYDFDDTIFDGNSYRKLIGYCIKRYPYLLLLGPVTGIAFLLHKLHILSKDAFLNVSSWTLVFVPNSQKVIEQFWQKNISRIKPWYKQVQQDDDVIISASPLYEISVVCKMLGVKNVIASNIDLKTAKMKEHHCYGKEKIVFWQQRFGDNPPSKFYTDSLSDLPMLCYAKEGYIVDGNTITLVYKDGKKVE